MTTYQVWSLTVRGWPYTTYRLSESALTISKWLQTIDIFTSVWFLFAVIPSKQYFFAVIKGSVRKTWYGLIQNWIRFWSLLILLLSGAYIRRKFSTFYPQATHGLNKNWRNSLKKKSKGGMEFLTLTFQRFKGHLCKYMAVFAWPVIWNYVYVPLK